MKSPQDIAERMQRQWQRKQFRLEMLTSVEAWPKQYTVGIPSANDITTTPNAILEHVARWQRVTVGEVAWRDVNYRASSEPIAMPLHWTLARPSDWVRATADRKVATDYDLLEFLIGHAAPEMRNDLIINLKLLRNRSREELVEALQLAGKLMPGEAQGRPLRLLAGHGVDTKFFERNRHLLISLLDSRFGGEVREKGLNGFLDASTDGDHWLLLMPLQRGLLPFEIQQVRSQELAKLACESIQASRILVVENRQCWHMLPKLDDTIAVLGSGLDLEWLKAEWLDGKDIAYWGDIDTWGLAMLARARQYRPQLTTVLTDRQTFVRYGLANAVIEPVTANRESPDRLNEDERQLYNWLLLRERGRLEQEFIPVERVHEVLKEWMESL